MFKKEIIEFFKRHNLYDEEMFNYIVANCDEVDYYDKDVNFMISCNPKVNRYTKKIEGFNLIIPYCFDELSTLAAVHEIAHAIYWYKKMGTKYNELEVELFPMIVERLYFEEHRSPALEKYEEFLDGTIDSTSAERYRFALENRDDLLEKDISDFKSLGRTIRIRSILWKIQNR